MNELEAGKQILTIINDAGHDAFFVGGCVRDMVMGRPYKDIDIATNMPMAKIEKLFTCFDIGANKTFGVACVKYEGHTFDVANFRTDGTYSDGRRPDDIRLVNTIEEDLSRRDLSINSLAMDKDGNIIDPYGGREDIKNKIIRCVGDPRKRFQEDYLRMLRAIRFANRFDFTMDGETMMAIDENAINIAHIAKERVFKEMYDMAGLHPTKFHTVMLDLGSFKMTEYIFDVSEYRADKMIGVSFGHHAKNIPEEVGEDIDFHVINFAYVAGAISVYTKKPMVDKLFPISIVGADLNEAIKFTVDHNHFLYTVHSDTDYALLNMMENKNFANACLFAESIEKHKQSNGDDIANNIKRMRLRIMSAASKFSGDNSLKAWKKKINGDYVMERTGMKPSRMLGNVIDVSLNTAINGGVNINDDALVLQIVLGCYKSLNTSAP